MRVEEDKKQIEVAAYIKTLKSVVVAAYIKTLKSVVPHYRLSFERILDGVKDDGSLYGYLIVDISITEHLKEKFVDFLPIIKNADVSRDDIGPYMQKIAEHEYLKKPQLYLISSYFGQEILINTEMVKFYLQIELEITRISEFIQFHPERCFENLALQIAEDRRARDQDHEKQILAMTSKFTGNSLYSASLLNKHSHRNITYHDDSRKFSSQQL